MPDADLRRFGVACACERASGGVSGGGEGGSGAPHASWCVTTPSPMSRSPEMLGETKHVMERAFDARYKLGKHKPRKGWFN